MKITVNGKLVQFDGNTLVELFDLYTLKPETIVVEYNGEIVHREHYAQQKINGGDIIELVRFVGGGVINNGASLYCN